MPWEPLEIVRDGEKSQGWLKGLQSYTDSAALPLDLLQRICECFNHCLTIKNPSVVPELITIARLAKNLVGDELKRATVNRDIVNQSSARKAFAKIDCMLMLVEREMSDAELVEFEDPKNVRPITYKGNPGDPRDHDDGNGPRLG